MNYEAMIAKAVAAYPNAKTETEALCLSLSNLEYHRSESLEVFNLNASQASIIAKLSLKVESQARELDLLRREVGK